MTSSTCILSCLAVLIAGACAPAPCVPPRSPAPPAAPPATCPLPTATSPDLSWLLDPSTKHVTVTEDHRLGYGADFVALRVELIVPEGGDAQGWVTEVAFSSSTPPRTRARKITLSRASMAELLRSLALAKPGSQLPKGAIILDRSDTYQRTELRVRSADDAHDLQVFSSSHGRTPRRWWLRTGAGRTELDASEIERWVAPLLTY